MREIPSATLDAATPAGQVLLAVDVEMVVADGRRILGPATLTIRPGTLTALIGPSGSGKTTLLRSLAGITVPTGGRVTLDGTTATRRVEDLGYVPQRETLNDFLTVREALRYAAALRLEPGADIDARIGRVMRELGLEEQAETYVRDLSGGERRRAACGLELVGQPKVLLLDEPTSGLDPVLERRLMQLFRRLADDGRAVVVSTHVTASLDLCDRIAVMSRGSLTSTEDADHAIASLRLAAGPSTPPATEGRPAEDVPEDVRAASPATARRAVLREYRLLTSRYARTLSRDRKTLRVILGQAPIIGMLIVLLFGPNAFQRGSDDPAETVQLIFLVMTGSIWLGITAACREIIKERGMIEREFDVGLRADAYVAAKATVLFGLSTVQVLLVLGVVLFFEPLGEPVGSVLVLMGLAVLVAWVSVALGLVVSALARTVDQAAGIVPLILVPQLLFAGALVPLQRMPDLATGLAQLTYARWAYASMGSAIDVDSRLQARSDVNTALGFGRTFFGIDPLTGAAVLACFLLCLLALAATLLQWRAPADDG